MQTIAADIVEILHHKKVRYVVLSPGSRCAPLVLAFVRKKQFECLSIVDERSAAFFALGLAQQTRQLVVLVCTSGSALLNYAPALAEAFYQRLPILVLSADRPQEWIGQADGQTITQNNVFQNFVKKSFQLPNVQQPNSQDVWLAQRTINEAANLATERGNFGPVHVNVPLYEPLYQEPKISQKIQLFDNITFTETIAEDTNVQLLKQHFESFETKMILVGLHPKDSKLNTILSQFAKRKDVLVVVEVTSNLHDDNFICFVDGILGQIAKKDWINFYPDLLITIGSNIVSKRLKLFLRSQDKAFEHWHIDQGNKTIDTFQKMTRIVAANEVQILKHLINTRAKDTTFANTWHLAQKRFILERNSYLKCIEFSDLKAFEIIGQNLPPYANLQIGNSMPIRYFNFVSLSETTLTVNCNRGTSGIEGTLSTACGAAFANPDKLTFVVLGDISFLYDSNALWNKHLPQNLRIIVINNSGGNIFRMIEAASVQELEEYFEARHQISLEKLVLAHGLHYFYADNEQTLEKSLQAINKGRFNKAVVLEVKTNPNINASILNKFYE